MPPISPALNSTSTAAWAKSKSNCLLELKSLGLRAFGGHQIGKEGRSSFRPQPIPRVGPFFLQCKVGPLENGDKPSRQKSLPFDWRARFITIHELRTVTFTLVRSSLRRP